MPNVGSTENVSIAKNSAKPRIKFLDCSRALCMLWIVGIWHMQEYMGLNFQNPITKNVTAGVLATFTLISGYFIGKNKFEGKENILRFFKKTLSAHISPVFPVLHGFLCYEPAVSCEFYFFVQAIFVNYCRSVMHNNSCSADGMVRKHAAVFLCNYSAYHVLEAFQRKNFCCSMFIRNFSDSGFTADIR